MKKLLIIISLFLILVGCESLRSSYHVNNIDIPEKPVLSFVDYTMQDELYCFTADNMKKIEINRQRLLNYIDSLIIIIESDRNDNK